MKNYRVVITDQNTGEQTIHEVEAFTLLSVASEQEDGFTAAIDTRKIKGKQLHALIGALKDEHPELKLMDLMEFMDGITDGEDCNCPKCTAKREAANKD